MENAKSHYSSLARRADGAVLPPRISSSWEPANDKETLSPEAGDLRSRTKETGNRRSGKKDTASRSKIHPSKRFSGDTVGVISGHVRSYVIVQQLSREITSGVTWLLSNDLSNGRERSFNLRDRPRDVCFFSHRKLVAEVSSRNVASK